MMTKACKIVFVLFISASLAAAASAQTSKRKAVKRPSAATVKSTPAPQPSQPEPEPEIVSNKRNGRPDAVQADAQQKTATAPAYFYIFTRPGFTYSRIEITHDESGRGQISMQKGGFDEPFVDPIELSAVTLEKIKEALTAMNFLDSTEEYQVPRDYSHMGNIEFRLEKGGRSRVVRYNWTENKHAKALADEYRRISNEYTWRFEILVARQNQPLLTPGLMDAILSYHSRGELSDPPHLLPFLNELSLDERLPLMARNRALKLIKDIEKAAKKK